VFSYYGAKTKIVDMYPYPKYDTIIEPFAGSARYSLKYYDREIILYETYSKVYEVWKYLISATMSDILALPDVHIGDDIRNLNLTNAEKWLMGYQLQRGNARPGCIVNERCNWNLDKIRISKEVSKVKHWKIFNSDGIKPKWDAATYFIDPPYSVQKHGYNEGSVDYVLIKRKIMMGIGQFIVCGNSDDTWIDFIPMTKMRGINKSHIECMYYKES